MTTATANPSKKGQIDFKIETVPLEKAKIWANSSGKSGPFGAMRMEIVKKIQSLGSPAQAVFVGGVIYEGQRMDEGQIKNFVTTTNAMFAHLGMSYRMRYVDYQDGFVVLPKDYILNARGGRRKKEDQ